MKIPEDVLQRDGYRLPTEAEWEFACRSGTLTRWYHGESDALLAQYAWYKKNSPSTTMPIGLLRPNDLGLFDMLGNAWEWCQERAKIIPPIPKRIALEDRTFAETVWNRDDRLQRSGAYFEDPVKVRSAERNMNPPNQTHESGGFRIVRTVISRNGRARSLPNP